MSETKKRSIATGVAIIVTMLLILSSLVLAVFQSRSAEAEKLSASTFEAQVVYTTWGVSKVESSGSTSLFFVVKFDREIEVLLPIGSRQRTDTVQLPANGSSDYWSVMESLNKKQIMRWAYQPSRRNSGSSVWVEALHPEN